MRTALCLASLYRPRYTAVTYLVTDATTARLVLRRRALRTAFRFASLQTSLHSRYIPRYRRNHGPAGAAEARFAYCVSLCLVTDLVTQPLHTSLQTQPRPGWCCGGARCVLRFALPRYRPRYIAVTDPTPARASDPVFCRRLACVEQLQSSWSCGGALCVLRFALPRYRPRYIAVTDPTPARASDPVFCRSLACVE